MPPTKLKSDAAFLRLTAQVKLLKKKLKAERQKNARLRNRKYTKNDIKSAIKPYLSKAAHHIFCAQIDNHEKVGKKAHGRRYSDDVKIICLGLKYQSTKAYNFLLKIFCLPSIDTLERCVCKGVQMEPGLNPAIIETLSKKVSSMSKIEKDVVICFDEMNVKTSLSYRPDSDAIDGFENHGDFGTSKKEYASLALVVEVHGYSCKWKQPLGYLLSNSATPADVLYNLAMKAIDEMTRIGLNVKVLISDLGSCNQSLFKSLLNVSSSKPYFHRNGDVIYVMYDSPHLIKCARNNLISSDYYVREPDTRIGGVVKRNYKFVASWKHFEELARLDTLKPNMMRLIPKIGMKTHVKPNNFKRMKVKYATQAFSHTVSAAMTTHAVSPDSTMPLEAAETANFFKLMDSLFDTFNSSKRFDSKPYKCAISEESAHHQFLVDTRAYLSRLVKLNKSGRFTKPPCFDGWIQNINALLLLWEDQKAEGMTFLRTRLLSQDFLENLFGLIRSLGGNRDNPTVTQFRDALRRAMVTDVLDLQTSQGTNCEADTARFLFDFAALKTVAKDNNCLSVCVEKENPEKKNYDVLPPVVASKAEVLTFCDENILYYVAGVCVRKYVKLIQDHNECNCATFVRKCDPKFQSPNQIFTHLKAYSNLGDDFGALQIPTEGFLNCIRSLNDVFLKHFDKFVSGKNLVRNIMAEIAVVVDMSWFPTGEICIRKIKEVLKYFVRMRIYYVLKTINQSVTELPKTKENRKYKTIANL